jgi:solute carrier family 9 (sodium/hydrogen exchanger), member 3
LPSIQHEKNVHGSQDPHAAEEGTHERYPVTTVDFSRVETPFIIGIWILFASIAKIGECRTNLKMSNTIH